MEIGDRINNHLTNLVSLQLSSSSHLLLVTPGAGSGTHADPSFRSKDGAVGAHLHLRQKNGVTRISLSRRCEHSLGGGAHPVRTGLRNKVLTHVHLRSAHTRGQDGGRRVAAKSRLFFTHFRTHFPQIKPWSLLPSMSACRRQLTNILHIKISPKVFPQKSSIKMPLPGANGSASAAGCISPLTHKASNFLSLSSIFLPSTPVLDFYMRRGTPPRSNR